MGKYNYFKQQLCKVKYSFCELFAIGRFIFKKGKQKIIRNQSSSDHKGAVQNQPDIPAEIILFGT